VIRTAIATAALTIAFADIARAETKRPAEPEPDEIADIEAREANLESKEPRKGFTFAAAFGGGIMLGGDLGVGRGPAVSLRFGHVATRKTVITFELAGGGALHKPALMDDTVTDNNFGFFVGAQRYTSRSVWVRAAGGLNVLVKNADVDGGGGDPPQGGIGGLVGGGFDIARWGYLVLGLETFAMTTLTSDGLKVQLAFNLGLSYY
jgi:hypothetical protein